MCASPAYLEQKGIPDSPSVLRQHDCIALRENSEDVTLWRFNRDNEEYPIRIHPRLCQQRRPVVTDWALAGRGIIVRSEWDVMPHLNRGKLVRVLQDFNLPDAPVVALTGSDAAGRSPRTRQFIRFLKEFFPSLGL
jgi:DNA-binding transcriptional LysR family regulator